MARRWFVFDGMAWRTYGIVVRIMAEEPFTSSRDAPPAAGREEGRFV
jgi:hypothetical protein